MHTKKRKGSGNSIMRAVVVGLSLLLQIGWLLLIILELNRYSTYIALFSSLLASLIVLRLYSKDTNSAFKLPWIMLIMALPVMGMSLYLMTQIRSVSRYTQRKLRAARASIHQSLPDSDDALKQIASLDPAAAGACRHLLTSSCSPVYKNTSVTYYPEAVQAFEAMKLALEQAEDFIFMEYFIVDSGEAFSQIREILSRKARQGVDVRLMYDDFGSIGYVNLRFARELNQEGIRCQVFNPALPVLNLFMNHRDHRKITVIDGKIGFTGGYNLANEYFGITQPYGHWKDTGIRMEGDAVQGLTATFLELWSAAVRTNEDPARYLSVRHSVSAQGFVQPFGDDPLDSEPAAENAYLNIIGSATKYVWFMTPYLIITDELSRALGLAAKRGVDVRIITPGIPDKKPVYAVTRSYYAQLIRQGVRIFEYTPGFCHGKQCVSDGKVACIGTSNLDYRSLYHHFENNTMLYHCPAVADIEQDFAKTFSQCREVTEEYRSSRPVSLRIWQCILRLFSPLL